MQRLRMHVEGLWLRTVDECIVCPFVSLVHIVLCVLLCVHLPASP